MVNLNRFRRRNQQQAQRIIDKPDRERHYLSIIGSILSCILLIVCLCLKEWANADNGKCTFVFGLTLVSYIDESNTQTSLSMTDYYNTSQQILISCMLSVSVLVLISSIVGTVISAGYPRERMEFLRHFAVFNIVSLLCTALVAGLWLAVVETLPTNKECPVDSNVDIHFGYSYYILLVSGLFSLGGASFNLLFAKSAADRRRALRNRYRQEQINARQLTNRSAVSSLTGRARRSGPPPLYNLVESTTDVSDTEGEAETSMSEPEYTETEPESPPPAYVP